VLLPLSPTLPLVLPAAAAAAADSAAGAGAADAEEEEDGLLEMGWELAGFSWDWDFCCKNDHE
jgi:hypothetical protein